MENMCTTFSNFDYNTNRKKCVSLERFGRFQFKQELLDVLYTFTTSPLEMHVLNVILSSRKWHI